MHKKYEHRQTTSDVQIVVASGGGFGDRSGNDPQKAEASLKPPGDDPEMGAWDLPRDEKGKRCEYGVMLER